MINVFQAHQYVNALGNRQSDEGARGWTWFATLKDKNGKDFNAAVKLYPAEYERKAQLGEVIGFLIAKASGIPVPRCAGFIYIAGPIASRVTGQSNSSSTLAWFSSLVGTTPKFYIQNKRELTNNVLAQIKNWPHLNTCLNVDEWLCNQDRNLGNLCISSKGTISVIDHGELPIHKDWNVSMLDPHFLPVSMLANITEGKEYIHELSWPLFERIKLIEKNNATIFKGLQEEIEYWARQLFPNEPDLVNSLMEFFEARAHNGGSRLAKLANVMDF